MNVPTPARTGLAFIIVLLVACDSEQDQGPGPVREPVDRTERLDNPIEEVSPVPLDVPPFHEIRPEHFLPAMETAVEQAEKRIAEIANNDAEPDFDNTVLALESAGRNVARIARLWYGLTAIDKRMAAGAEGDELTRLLAEHEQRILHNRSLFERIGRVRDSAQMDELGAQQRRLVEETWRRFRRGGAHLDETNREELAQINRRIANLDHRYSQLRISATHRHELLFEDERRLRDLPESLVLLARQSARDRGHAESWAFTLHAHSFYPFMRHFPEREQRRDLYRAWMTRYDDERSGDENLSRLIEQLAELRAERATLLGFDSHLDYLLDDASLSNRSALENLLDRLATAARKKAGRELERLEEMASEDGIAGELQPWDWWYYRERLIESTLAFDESALRQSLELGQVREGLFTLANRLWGLTFHRRRELPAWHMDVSAFEVRDAMGSTLGVVYFDPVHRSGKRGGAWTSQYRIQHRSDGERANPVTAIVANLTPPAADMPALLSPDQVRTLFHEFGHALHSLLSDVEYAALAGTNVPPDFVEFPALLLERWSMELEVLRNYARHHETGALIDDRTMEALQQGPTLTGGLQTLEFLAAIELDLALHGAPPGEVPDLETAEGKVRDKLDLPAMISPRHHGGGLASLFSSRRSGGDFRTLWSELLAADAFAAFEEAGLTNRELAERLREEILSRGNARAPMDSWQAFRNRPPEVRFLLAARGLPVDQDEANTPGGE